MAQGLKRRDRREVARAAEDWVEVNEKTLPEKEASVFEKRADAIRFYLAGGSLEQIKKDFSLSTKELYRYLDRCETESPDGSPYGWRGLLFGQRILPRKISKKDQSLRLGHANEFAQFLSRFPNIRENLISLAKTGRKVDEKGPNRKLSVMKIKEKMIADCWENGLTIRDYPLSTESEGYGAVRRFVIAARRDHAGGKFPAGGISDLPPVLRCYQRVELDGHKKDVICTVELPSPTSRGVYYLPIERLWLIPLIESKSTAALGYSIAYGLNYSTSDLIKAIRSSIFPWKPMELTAPNLRYPDGGGFPTGLDEKLAFVCIDEILLDNHKAHLSSSSESELHRVLGATPVYGSIDNQNARALAEGFFLEFERVLQLLPSATGSDPKNRPVSNPTKNAIKFKITDQHIHEIAEITLARYNIEKPPGSSLSRVELLQRYVNDPRQLVRRIPNALRESIELYDTELVLPIKGDEKNNIRPYVYWEGSRYDNSVIASSYGLIGQKLFAYTFSGDIRKLKAYFKSGADAGVLICERRFQQTPHSLTTRKHANASRRAKKHRPDSTGDDIAGYTNSIINTAPKSKKAATEAARLKAELRTFAAQKKDRGNNALNGDGQGEQKEKRRSTNSWMERVKKIGTRF